MEISKYVAGLKDQTKRPDLVLVNSPINDYTGVVRPDTEQLPAFGLAHIATECEAAGFNVGLVDAETLALSPEMAGSIINSLNPRWVGINMLTPTFPLGKRILQGLAGDIKVVGGGAHAKALPERILRDPEVGGRIQALALEDGEYIMRGLLAGVDPSEMGGVAYLDQHGDYQEVRGDESKLWIPWDLDHMQLADRKFLPGDPFSSQGRMETHMVGSRGCPFNCRFCAGARENLVFGVRNRTPENMIDELKMLRGQEITAVRFIDDLFLANKRRMEGFFGQMIETGLNDDFVWDATGRVNTLSKMDDSTLEMMARSGCREVSIGVESASPRMLGIMDKGIDPGMVLETVRKLAKVGIRTKGYFILGSPTETMGEMEETVSFMHKLREESRDMVHQNPRTPSGRENNGQFRGSMFEFRPYPGTALYDFIVGNRPWPESMLVEGIPPVQYTEDEILSGFQPVLNSQLPERQKHSYTTELAFSENEPAQIQALIAQAMIDQRNDMNGHSEYLPGIRTSSNQPQSREVESI